MPRPRKLHRYFSIDTRFTVSPHGGLSSHEGTPVGELGLAFPLYLIEKTPSVTGYAPASVWDMALVGRLLRGGDGYVDITPSKTYARRLLEYHYSGLRSQRARTEFLAHVRSIVRKAINDAEHRLANPGPLDLARSSTLKHLKKELNVLVYGLQWVETQAKEKKAERPALPEPTNKVKVLAYLMLIEAGEMPALKHFTSRTLAETIASELQAKGARASAASIQRYIDSRKPGSAMFIRTEENYQSAVAWIRSQRPTVDPAALPPLRRL